MGSCCRQPAGVGHRLTSTGLTAGCVLLIRSANEICCVSLPAPGQGGDLCLVRMLALALNPPWSFWWHLGASSKCSHILDPWEVQSPSSAGGLGAPSHTLGPCCVSAPAAASVQRARVCCVSQHWHGACGDLKSIPKFLKHV